MSCSWVLTATGRRLNYNLQCLKSWKRNSNNKTQEEVLEVRRQVDALAQALKSLQRDDSDVSVSARSFSSSRQTSRSAVVVSYDQKQWETGFNIEIRKFHVCFSTWQATKLVVVASGEQKEGETDIKFKFSEFHGGITPNKFMEWSSMEALLVLKSKDESNFISLLIVLILLRIVTKILCGHSPQQYLLKRNLLIGINLQSMMNQLLRRNTPKFIMNFKMMEIILIILGIMITLYRCMSTKILIGKHCCNAQKGQ
ncbi:PREDICTED: uncharacterized protein LOC104599314 [Nelumbo nucifera]|uniref:Uncharacterized protein LOC104599314 n=1 Tax=Nelumbo nucifera TaxID=4432 RepID=A0A1U8Q4Q8_NELNU|nr:PREDICTED: uncharacterized protein LOC104599314 [Nelumbo nucifera]